MSNDFIYQRDGLADLVAGDDFLLIILDACRWDALNHVLGGMMPIAISPATLTVRWLRACWPGTYDITYVAANPHIAPTPRETSVTYDGTQHFDELVYLADEGWDEELRTVPPEPLRDATIDHRETGRLITHYLQPHVPFIGEPRFPEMQYGPILGPGQGKAYEAADASQEELREGYLANLEEVWERGVEPLLTAFEDRRVVVSADHGELLGENGKWGHGHIAWPVLLVPWLEFPPGEMAVAPPAIEWAAEPERDTAVIHDFLDQKGLLPDEGR